MGYLERLEQLIAEQESKKEQQPESTFTLERIPYVRLSELAKRNIAIEIYSEILGCNVWLCSNEKMAVSVKEDSPAVVTYTVAEIRELVRLNPSPDELKRIHSAKSVFPGSKIIDSTLQGDRDDNN